MPSVGGPELVIEVGIALLKEFAVVDGSLGVEEVEDVVVLGQRLDRLVREQRVGLEALPEVRQTPRCARVIKDVRILLEEILEILQRRWGILRKQKEF